MKRRLSVAASALLAATACGSDGPSNPTQRDLTCTVSTDQIFFGGVSRDGIPALVEPEFVTAAAADFIANDTRILGIVINGEARAYPMNVLWYHEVVNDVLANENILVSYCPLTGSGLAFDPFIDGAVREFGVSGLLFENNLIMFDRQTQTLWNQLSLGGICGLERGRDLARLPIIETTWGYWKSLYPFTTVVTSNTGFDFPYGIYPYGDYAALDNPRTLFTSSEWSDAQPPKELVLGIREQTETIAYPFGELDELGDVVAVNGELGSRPFVVIYKASDRTAIAFDRTAGDQTLTFTVLDTALVKFQDAETGSTWNRRGLAEEGPLAGTQLAQLADAHTLFWFSWSVYHPNTELFLAETP